MRTLCLSCLLIGCADGVSPDVVQVGAWTVAVDRDRAALTVTGPRGVVLDDLVVQTGAGTQSIQETAGAALFSDVTHALTRADRVEGFTQLPDGLDVVLGVGDDIVRIGVTEGVGGHLVMEVQGSPAGATGTPRLEFSAGCEADDHFLGLGSHAQDVDHVGEAFALWVTEPGIGKRTDDVPGGDWPLVGTRHASSYPMPWLLRPQQPSGTLIDTEARVEVDLCHTDPDRFSAIVWDHAPTLHLFTADTPLQVVEQLTEVTGRPRRLPDWALAPWNDAIRGAARVATVASTIRSAGASSSAIWTEDWKGGSDEFTGYRLSESWTLDTGLYPDATGLAADLADQGFAWFSYYAPFLGLETEDGQDAVRAGAVIVDDDGVVLEFAGITFLPTTSPDLTSEAGVTWVRDRLQRSVDLGFRGWMVDFGEWLPTRARLADGTSGLDVHNGYPKRWQAVNEEVLAPIDGVGWCRAGWVGTQATCPVVWVGDQRTDFQPDDGFPTVLPLILGLSAGGVPVATHDVAGYMSLSNPPSDQELWFRWAALATFSPIFRTHHGSSDLANHQFDTNAETLAYFARMSGEHMRLWPYRAGLARQAAERGTPMVLPTSFVFDGEPWDRTDAWMLGPSLLVAPVTERGATSRRVDLPSATTWRDWWTLQPAASGAFDAPLDQIPVFLAANATVPLFDVVPHTLLPTDDDGVLDAADGDSARRVLLTGQGAPFLEADGTRYTPRGRIATRAEVTRVLQAGEVDVGGLTVKIEGPVERTYTLVALP